MAYDSNSELQIRCYRDPDAVALAQLFFKTIREVNIKDYSQEQVEAWAPKDRDMELWRESFSGKYVLVADSGSALAGFGELEPNGHIDRFYIGAKWIGRGVGKQIYGGLEERALEWGLKRLFVESSITAKPFFQRLGYQVLKEQRVERRGVKLTNFVMEKHL